MKRRASVFAVNDGQVLSKDLEVFSQIRERCNHGAARRPGRIAPKMQTLATALQSDARQRNQLPKWKAKQ
jgi:hypothetical protein